jgi:hypothetical protein
VFSAAVRELRLVGSIRLMARAKPLRHLVSRPTYRGLSALASRQSKFGIITLAVDLCRILTIEPDEQTGLTDVWRRSHYEANCQSCQTAGLSSILLLQRKKRRPLGRLSGSGGCPDEQRGATDLRVMSPNPIPAPTDRQTVQLS